MIKALIFDVFGTVVDWRSSVILECKILEEKTGDKGFGYDPIFRPNGFDVSFAQMSTQQKNEISHRGLAVKKLVEFLQNKQ